MEVRVVTRDAMTPRYTADMIKVPLLSGLRKSPRVPLAVCPVSEMIRNVAKPIPIIR
ncbi:hypothetical protein D3C87_1905620 [compost metagenome]